MAMKLQKLYDQTPIGICVVRRDGRDMNVLYANDALIHMMGKSQAKAQDIIGTPLEEAWPSEEVRLLTRKLKRTTPPKSETLPIEDGDTANKRWVQLTIQENEFDGEEAYILWATDISDNKEIEARLEQAVEEADAAAEVKSNFLATMSHEIRTPMQTIYGLLELVGEEKPDIKIKSMIDIAKTSASGLLEILDDILDMAKMDANSMELDLFEVPVRTLVRGINEALAVKIHGNDVELLDDIDEDVPFVVIGDPKRLRQIIMNLAGNALKFTSAGTVTVYVSNKPQILAQPETGFVLRFEIIDTGIGMSEETCGKLFQSFTQADNSTSRKYGGTGLGLSISKKLVTLMDGEIGVTSVEGQGSVFWFEIPTEEVGTDNKTVDMPKLDGISILSVEDHPQGAKEIVRSLESMGATVESCPTYKEGLELVKRRPFDVGIIDQGLPDGLGLELIREIMNIRSFMGLIMYTVRDDIGMQHTLNALGATYLAKPASRLGLGEVVKDAARKSVKVNIDGPTRLLIAEDTESVRDVLSRQLEKLNVEADFVVNGKEALTALKTGKYGILFTDLHMPEIDGYELIASIRKKEAEQASMRAEGETVHHFPVVVLTADVQMTQRQTYLGRGFDECLLKPVSLGQFRRLLIRWGLLEETEEDIYDTEEPEKIEQGDEMPEKNAVDIEAVKAQMGALDEGTIEMLHLFIEMTESLIERIKNAHQHEDFNDLKEAAHSLKGGARSACCNILGDIAGQLQDDAAEQKPSCGTLVEDIAREFERAQEAIKNLKPL